MKKIFFQYLLIIFLCPAISINAQQESGKEDNSSCKLGIFYNSHLNYYGRTDSLRSSGIFPLAELWFNKNFYLNGAPVFINNAASTFEYAGSVITLGYMAKSKDEKTLSHIYITTPIYKKSSGLVQ